VSAVPAAAVSPADGNRTEMGKFRRGLARADEWKRGEETRHRAARRIAQRDKAAFRAGHVCRAYDAHVNTSVTARSDLGLVSSGRPGRPVKRPRTCLLRKTGKTLGKRGREGRGHLRDISWNSGVALPLRFPESRRTIGGGDCRDCRDCRYASAPARSPYTPRRAGVGWTP
jgi:hypothetical protein